MKYTKNFQNSINEKISSPTKKRKKGGGSSTRYMQTAHQKDICMAKKSE